VVASVLDFIFKHFPIWWFYIKILSWGGGNIGFRISTKHEFWHFTYIFLFSWICVFNIMSVLKDADVHLLMWIHWYIIITDLYTKIEFDRDLLGTFKVLIVFSKDIQEPSWSYGSWIYNYLCNQCISPLTLWVLIQLRWYVMKVVSDLRQVGGFLQVLRFPPPIKLTATI